MIGTATIKIYEIKNFIILYQLNWTIKDTGEITSIFYQYSDSEATDTELNVLCLNVQL